MVNQIWSKYNLIHSQNERMESLPTLPRLKLTKKKRETFGMNRMTIYFLSQKIRSVRYNYVHYKLVSIWTLNPHLKR